MKTVRITDRSGSRGWLAPARAAGEFTVVKRAPLSLPPEYALRPPEPGAPRPQEPSPTAQARQQVLGTGGGPGGGAAQQQGAVAALGGGKPFAQSGFALGGAA